MEDTKPGKAFKRFLKFHDVSYVVIEKAQPKELKKSLMNELA